MSSPTGAIEPLDNVSTTTISSTTTSSTTTPFDSEALKTNLDNFFLIVMGIVVFLMQCGFAFLEAGAVRSKNAVNILIKNMLDALIGGLSYWAIGWGLAYGPGGNPFCGGSEFFSFNMEHTSYPSWFFQFVFAATAATIISGAVAERCHFYSYFAYSIIITGNFLEHTCYLIHIHLVIDIVFIKVGSIHL